MLTRLRKYFRRFNIPEPEAGFVGGYDVVWTIVGILAILALIVWLVHNLN